ncbi:MAG TPA: EAL domain-containing protein [Rudaea sp.]|nr:EAL domain-containing protein [Rudaea sp.]
MANILVVDDRAINREFLSTLLGYAGHEVHQATDGADALESVRAQRPDLVITDVMMPTMSGSDFVMLLRANRETADVPVIFFTATHRVPEARRLAQSCGVTAVLSRPAEAEQILEAVEAVVGSAPLPFASADVAARMPGFFGSALPAYLRKLTELQVSLRERLDEAGEWHDSKPSSDSTEGALSFQVFSLRLAALLELDIALSSERDPQALLTLFCRSAQDIMNCQYSALGILDSDGRRLKYVATRGLSDEVQARIAAIDPAVGVFGKVLTTGVSYRASSGSGDATTLPGLENFHPTVDSLLVVPLPVRSATPLTGWIYFAQHLGGEAFSEEDERFAVTMTAQFALAYGNLVLYDGVKRAAEELRESDRRFRELFDNVELIALMLDLEARVTYCNDYFLNLTGWKREELLNQPWFERFPPPEERQARAAGYPKLLAGDRTAQQSMEREILTRTGERRLVRLNHTLLRSASGEVTGVASIGEDVTSQRRAQAELAHSLTHDMVTDLPRFVLIEEYLQQACVDAAANDGRVIVFYLDLDRFHSINETQGRAVGDHVLRTTADRLKDLIGVNGRVAHVAADEFAIVLKDPVLAQDQVEFGETMRARIEDLIHFEERRLFVSCSVGVSCFPDNGSSPQELLRQAESAMLRAKHEGRNTVIAFANEHKQELDDRFTLGLRLGDALRNGEFLLHYQPQISGQDWRICGFEALLRWQSPEFGFLTPKRFLQVAEDLGLMDEIASFVLDAACRQARAWIDAGIDDFSISINVSPTQMHRQAFVAEMRNALAQWRLPASFIGLELTESMMTGNVERVTGTMRALKALGVKLSLDDFGTGYSSLNYLRRFPIDTLKIDQSFVHDISTDAGAAGVCRAIITLGHQLGMTVLAEGVENAAQVGYLRRNDCDFFQGYYFCKPVSSQQALEILRHRYLAHEGIEQPPEQQPTLLLVDDEENILNALIRMLRRDGYRILTATGADDALDVLGRNDVQVVISDQRMPGTSGTELLSKVKEMYPDTVRMVLSGYTDLAAVTAAINQGAIYKFLTKPWNDEELRLQIRDAFRIARRPHESRKSGASA